MKPNAITKKGKKNKREKILLVFDETKRKDFLLGFRKRKDERRRKAQENIKQKFKEEKRRIKQESKEAFKHLVLSHKPLPELEDILQEEYETGDVSVKVVELSSDKMKGKSRWIGNNQPEYEEDEKSESDSESESEEVPGMDLKSKPFPKPAPKPDSNLANIVNIKKKIRTEAAKKLQSSKAFKMKTNMERGKNRKKAKLDRRVVKKDRKRQERNEKKGKFNKKVIKQKNKSK